MTANATPPPIAYTMPAAAANGLESKAFDPLGYWASFATEVDVNLMLFHNEYGAFSIKDSISQTNYVALQANGYSSYPYIYSYTNAATLPSNNATIITLVYNHANFNFMVDNGYSGNEQVYTMLFQSPINVHRARERRREDGLERQRRGRRRKSARLLLTERCERRVGECRVQICRSPHAAQVRRLTTAGAWRSIHGLPSPVRFFEATLWMASPWRTK